MDKKKYLSAKEVMIDDFLVDFVNKHEASTSQHGASGCAADMAQQKAYEAVEKEMTSLSVILSQRYKSHIQHILSLKDDDQQKEVFGSIQAHVDEDQDMADSYRACFDAFVDDTESVSFVASSKGVLKDIEPKDAFILTFYAIATTRRSANDNILQLILSGVTSSGNSQIFCVN